MINQCDGCARGLPVETSTLGGTAPAMVLHRGRDPWDVQACTRARYADPYASEPAVIRLRALARLPGVRVQWPCSLSAAAAARGNEIVFLPECT